MKILSISLGEVDVDYHNDNLPLEKIKSVLEQNGFELIEDRRIKLIEQVKSIVIKSIYQENGDLENLNFSELIGSEVKLDYNYISSLFSSTEGITIEHYIIIQKIERSKELLKYGELTLSEIAYQLGYSSVQHLSNQFKKVTGLTASQFKNMTRNTRKSLDKII